MLYAQFCNCEMKRLKTTKSMRTKRNFLLSAMSLVCCLNLQAQKHVTSADTAKVKSSENSERNVMLNAQNNVGPREINVGLPASVGGTNIFQNGMPVSYHFWPEMPTTVWRQDATVAGGGLMGLTDSAVEGGTVGYTATTTDNCGTNKLKIKGNLEGNHFGLLRATACVSGPLGNGWKYVAGGYISYDPGTFDAPGVRKYYADDAKMIKLGLTKDYISSIGKGSVTLFYRYGNVKTLQNSYFAPYIYGEGGSINKYEGFNIGTDNYLINTDVITMKDAFSGELKKVNLVNEYQSQSHAFDLLWGNIFHNGLKFDFSTRFRRSNVGIASPVMSGVAEAGSNYRYLDGTSYMGKYVQTALYMNTRRTPIYTWITQIKLGRKDANHTWSVGIQELFYHIDRYATEVANYHQSVENNPRIVVPTSASTGYTDGFYGFNSFMEYHKGNMNKIALILKDTWDVLPTLQLKTGIRLEYQTLRGKYMPLANRHNGTLLGETAPIKDDFLNKTAAISAIWKVTRLFGLQADAMYTEVGGILGNYNTGANPNLKQSKTPMVSGGVYYNHPKLSIVSKVSYISKSNYSANSNFTNPQTNATARAAVKYDVKTIGWTTDIIFKPTEFFRMHFLMTLQDPKYGNYNGKLNFTDGTTRDFDFNSSNVTGISKFLLEFDPTFTYKNADLQLHARYFGKQYANLSNTLSFEPHWETFARLGYKFNKHINAYINVVNLLNQRFAKGSISGTDLMTADEAKSKYGTVMTGTYIRPFTVEFGLGFNF